MRRALGVHGIVLAALPLACTALAAAPAAFEHGARSTGVRVHHASPRAVLYDDTGTDANFAVVSQNFEQSYEVFDAAAADDFDVPKGSTWTLRAVDVIGVYFNGKGPAASEDVIVYKDRYGFPGRVVAQYTGLAGKDDRTGSFRITVPKTRLHAGHYWLSVVANLRYQDGGGEWGWENMVEVHGNLPEWENPGSWVPCPSWGQENECLGSNVGDLFFTLEGEASGAR